MADSGPCKKEESKKRRKVEEDNQLALTLSLPQPSPPPPPPSPPVPSPPPPVPSPPLVWSTRSFFTSPTDHEEFFHPLRLDRSHSPFMRPVRSDYLRPALNQPRVVSSGGEVIPSSRLPRRNPSQEPANGKSETVPAPFRWASTSRATVYSLDSLLAHQILSIPGDVHCKNCNRRFTIEYDLRQKFTEIAKFIAINKNSMRDRAPIHWKNPIFPGCHFCKKEKSLRPIMAEKKRCINWLFLLLGQMLGYCTLEQLKYFCKHTKNHRTGAKDRVLYLTYLGLCKQLDPCGPFDV